MQIAIFGAGRLGSMFAFHLANAGHEVTVIARRHRLEQLQRDGAIVTIQGESAPVKVSAALDRVIAYDAVLVTLFAAQVGESMPALRASAAKKIIFMFNTFESLQPLRDAVGAERFVFAFPFLSSTLVDGKLKTAKLLPGSMTTIDNAEWAQVYRAAGIPAEVNKDMESYLRAHAAFAVPLMAMAARVAQRNHGVTWSEAMLHAQAIHEGFGVVHHLGNAVVPRLVHLLDVAPRPVIAGILWGMSRTEAIRDLAKLGTEEPKMLIDAMTAVSPSGTKALQAIRPS